MRNPYSYKILAAAAAAAMCATSSAAVASAPFAIAPQGSVSAFVALSALGSNASRAGLCGSTAAAAAGAAVAAQAQAPGCVLPIADTAPPVPVAEGAPPMMPPPMVGGGGFGFGVGPLLFALTLIAGALLVSGHHHDGFVDLLPNSPV